MMKEYFIRMAQYNRWMNERLYALIETIPDAVRKADQGAFFHSIHGILNHLLLTDGVWLCRFTGKPFAARPLDHELYSDFGELRREREKTDAAIEEWVAQVSEEELQQPFRFVPMAGGDPFERPLWHFVQHLFNHQTHHRGQLTTLLDQLGYDYEVTDLARLP